MTNERSAPPSSADELRPRGQSFPKDRRILKSAEFRRVYDEGSRITCALFAAFCREQPGLAGPQVGFTTPRALGKAVLRNRLKRRLREIVRKELWRVGPTWQIVFNPRRAMLLASPAQVEKEVLRVFQRCPAALPAPPSGATSS